MDSTERPSVAIVMSGGVVQHVVTDRSEPFICRLIDLDELDELEEGLTRYETCSHIELMSISRPSQKRRWNSYEDQRGFRHCAGLGA